MPINILIYADFDLLTVIISRPSKENKVVLDSLPQRYSKSEFKEHWYELLGIAELEKEKQISFYTNLLPFSPLYEPIDAIAIETWIDNHYFWQARYLEYNPTLKPIENADQAIAFVDLIASDLVEWKSNQIESRAVGYLKRLRKDKIIEDGLTPYLYWLKYCAEEYYSMWQF